MFGSFPRLQDFNFEVTSPATRIYNCIAWAAEDNLRWWWSDPENICWWPPGVRRELTIAAFVDAFSTLGYRLHFDSSLEAGFEKVALYARSLTTGELIPTHAALQLGSGLWSSKLGMREDIMHEAPEALESEVYGKVVCYLARPARTS